MARKRKDPYYHRGEPGVWSKILKALGVIAVIAVVLSLGWALTLWEPKKIKFDDPSAQPVGEVPREVSALLDQSKELEKNFAIAAKTRDITEADLSNLRESLRLQLDYLDKSHNRNLAEGNSRIARMSVLLQSYEAKPLRLHSIDLQSRASDLENQGDLDGAKKLLFQADELEKQIMRDYSKGNAYTEAIDRDVVLRHHIDTLTAQPMFDDSQSAEVTAKFALDRQNWQSALDNFKRALDLQLRLDREFPQQRFVDPARANALQGQITALRSLPDHQRVEKALADARAAEARGASDPKEYLSAAQFYQDALKDQSDLNDHYPDSRFADKAGLTSIRALLQTAQSHALADDIKTQAAALFDDLRHRQTDKAAATILALAQKAAQLHQQFPLSTLIDPDLQQRLDFLAAKRDSLAAIQEQSYALLLPVPGQQRYQLAKTEVNQTLYFAVAGGNPSRSQGPKLPVESVSWNEAQLFCKRLSWVLARPVRLPTIEEFHSALGPTDSLDVAAVSWNFDNSNGQTHDTGTKAANPNGFFDLLGNVAEWLDPPLGYDDDVAPIIGGTAQTQVDNIRAAPLAKTDFASRNPFTGFRFIVDTDDSVPVVSAPAASSSSVAK